MTPTSDSQSPEDPERQRRGYYRRDVEEFQKEANVLAGHDPEDVSSDPPRNLAARRWIVFAIIVVVGLIAAAIAVGLMALPQCANPQYNWLPCIPDLSG